VSASAVHPLVGLQELTHCDGAGMRTQQLRAHLHTCVRQAATCFGLWPLTARSTRTT